MAKAKKQSKKIIKTQLAEKMEKTFADLAQALGKTKFKRNIKKAAKALSQDLKELEGKVSEKKRKVKKEEEKK